MKYFSNTRGFTLVELLVVIAIIGILSVIVYANFQDARTDSKNRAFMAEMKELQLALELYKAQNGIYPPVETCGGYSGLFGYWISDSQSANCGSTPVIGDSFVPDFIAELPDPADSANSGCILQYQVDGDNNGTWGDNTDGFFYKVTGINCIDPLNPSGMEPGDELARCPARGVTSACVSTPYCNDNDTGFERSIAIYSAGGGCL